MKSLGDFFDMLGINALFIVGLFGSIIMSNTKKGINRWERIITIIGGAFTANYITPILLEMGFFSEKTKYAIAFVLGYSGLKTLEFAVRYIHHKINVNDNK